jgi:Holliday junction resolvasome RuvABC endonuclease subunit
VIFGVDLGVRSVSIFGLTESKDDGDPVAYHCEVAKSNRGGELLSLRQALLNMVTVDYQDLIVVEEPPYVNNRRTFGQLSMTAGAMLSVSSNSYPVAVDDWKKATVGRGGVGKPEVAQWLAAAHPELSARCAGNQNLVDAACIALYGQLLRGTSTRTH